jgi:hypothetical protein
MPLGWNGFPGSLINYRFAQDAHNIQGGVSEAQPDIPPIPSTRRKTLQIDEQMSGFALLTQPTRWLSPPSFDLWLKFSHQEGSRGTHAPGVSSCDCPGCAGCGST